MTVRTHVGAFHHYAEYPNGSVRCNHVESTMWCAWTQGTWTRLVPEDEAVALRALVRWLVDAFDMSATVTGDTTCWVVVTEASETLVPAEHEAALLAALEGGE